MCVCFMYTYIYICTYTHARTQVAIYIYLMQLYNYTHLQRGLDRAREAAHRRSVLRHRLHEAPVTDMMPMDERPRPALARARLRVCVYEVCACV
jgi:hypothetical protein